MLKHNPDNQSILKQSIMITLDNLLIFNLKSRHNGYNSFVKQALLMLSGVEDKPKWSKELIGQEISESMYQDLVRFKNLHLDDPETYQEMMTKINRLDPDDIKKWND